MDIKDSYLAIRILKFLLEGVDLPGDQVEFPISFLNLE